MSVAVNHRISPCYEWNKNRHRSRSENDCESCGKPAGGRRKRPRKLAASDINSISSTSSGSKETPVWPRSRRLPGASGLGFMNCWPRLPCPGLAPANRLPPQRPSPNPGNGRPGENVRENYHAVVARPAGSSAMLVWGRTTLRRATTGISALAHQLAHHLFQHRANIRYSSTSGNAQTRLIANARMIIQARARQGSGKGLSAPMSLVKYT